MPDISEHPHLGDLKRLLRELETADLKPIDPLSSLIREPSQANAAGRSIPQSPGSGNVLTVLPPEPSIEGTLPVQPGEAVPVRRSANGRGPAVWIGLALAVVSVAAAVGWSVRPLGFLASPTLLAALQDPPLIAEKVVKAPGREPSIDQGTSDPSSRGEAIRGATAKAEPPPPPAQSETHVAEANADAPLLGGRDKYELEARLDVYLERGQKLLDVGDITGARSFFSRVADSGDARGALAMGATYDPNYVVSLRIRGLQPDLDAAGRWYRRAMDLGSKDALDRLDRLGELPK